MSDLNYALPPGYDLEHYRIDQVLGIGGFGITYKALDRQLQQPVAIKEYLPAHLAGRAPGTATVDARSPTPDDFRFGLEQFLEEARVLARFKHPCIVRVQRFLEANGTAYMVMEYEEGQTLQALIEASEQALGEGELSRIFSAVLTGLAQVHRTGYLHRDIKPANIYLRRQGLPILIDFGAARQAVGVRSHCLTGIVSIGYAPPEQYTADVSRQGPWTDLYAVGATLYRCISGRDPVDSPTRREAIHEGEDDPLVPAVRAGHGRYRPELLRLIDQLLQTSYRKRPRDTVAVLEQLQADGPTLPNAVNMPAPGRSIALTRVIAEPDKGFAHLTDTQAPPHSAATERGRGPLLPGLLLLFLLLSGGVAWYHRAELAPRLAQWIPESAIAAVERAYTTATARLAELPQLVERPGDDGTPKPKAIESAAVDPPAPAAHPSIPAAIASTKVRSQPARRARSAPAEAAPPSPPAAETAKIAQRSALNSAVAEGGAAQKPALESTAAKSSAEASAAPSHAGTPMIDEHALFDAPTPSGEPPSGDPAASVGSTTKQLASTAAGSGAAATARGTAVGKQAATVSAGAATTAIGGLAAGSVLSRQVLSNGDSTPADRGAAGADSPSSPDQAEATDLPTPEPVAVRASSTDGPTARVSHGRLQLEVQPANARIVLAQGAQTYAPGMPLPPGDYALSFYAAGYANWHGRVRLRAAETTREVVAMEPRRPCATSPAGQRCSDPLRSGGQGPEMVVLPGGRYDRGDLSGQGDLDEQPVDQVKLKRRIAMMTHEVTLADYNHYARATGQPLSEGRGDHPVVDINWKDAADYAHWLSKQTRRRYRLPSEAEWEYAARAGAHTLYGWGDGIGQNRANCDGCGSNWDNSGPAPVGSFQPNPFGLHDMNGNVWEWVKDCYFYSYRGAPTNGRAQTNALCERRVVRGGSWADPAPELRSANRAWRLAKNQQDTIGVRLVQEFR